MSGTQWQELINYGPAVAVGLVACVALGGLRIPGQVADAVYQWALNWGSHGGIRQIVPEVAPPYESVRGWEIYDTVVELSIYMTVLLAAVCVWPGGAGG